MSKAGAYAAHAMDNYDELVNDFLHLVKRIAHYMVVRLPAHIEVDDLIQVGLIGLLEAAKNYTPSLGASFETYASIRIRGAIIDDLRRNDWVPRTVQLKIRQLAKATQEVENQLQRAASDTEIAQHMNLDIDTYHTVLRETSGGRTVDIDAAELTANTSDEPQQNMEESGFIKELAAQIEQLPEREKLVMSLYYEEELNLKEIGKVLGVSESRVSQIHSQAVARLRARLNPWVSTPPSQNH